MTKGGVIVLALAAVAATAAEVPVEFSGVLTNDGAPTLVLIDKSTGSKRWLRPGDTIQGFTVSGYDAKNDTAILARGGQEFRLKLTSPPKSTQPAVAPASPPPAIATIVPPTAATSTGAPTSTTPSAPAAAPAPPATANVPQPSTSMAATAPSPPAGTISTPPPASPEAPLPQTAPATTAATPAPSAVPPTEQPVPTGPTYLVQRGDSLNTIARATGLSVEQLQALNPNVNAGSLQPGQMVRIR